MIESDSKVTLRRMVVGAQYLFRRKTRVTYHMMKEGQPFAQRDSLGIQLAQAKNLTKGLVKPPDLISYPPGPQSGVPDYGPLMS